MVVLCQTMRLNAPNKWTRLDFEESKLHQNRSFKFLKAKGRWVDQFMYTFTLKCNRKLKVLAPLDYRVWPTLCCEHWIRTYMSYTVVHLYSQQRGEEVETWVTTTITGLVEINFIQIFSILDSGLWILIPNLIYNGIMLILFLSNHQTTKVRNRVTEQ